MYGTAFCEAMVGILQPLPNDAVGDAAQADLQEIWPTLFQHPGSLRLVARVSYAIQCAAG